MARYAVDIEEVYIRSVIVEADSVTEAREKASEESVTNGVLEFSYRLDPDDWNIENITNQK